MIFNFQVDTYSRTHSESAVQKNQSTISPCLSVRISRIYIIHDMCTVFYDDQIRGSNFNEGALITTHKHELVLLYISLILVNKTAVPSTVEPSRLY